MTDQIRKEKLSTLIIGTIGIVYEDIGTSPLYALKKLPTNGRATCKL